VAIAVGDIDGALLWRETLDVANGEAEADMAFIISFPVFHKVRDILDVNACAGNLPQTSVGWLAAGARVALVTGLLEEFAPQTSAKLADFVGLLSLFWA
jgi:hypothetical protein